MTTTFLRVLRYFSPVCFLLLCCITSVLAAEGGSPSLDIPAFWISPFAALLLCIAVLPLVAHHWWESNRNRALVSGFFALIFAAYMLIAFGQAGGVALLHAVLYEYLPFIVLLAALFVISGGIYIKGSLAGTPLSNSAILIIGGILASFIGTTGASMVLIRPLLRANQAREKKVHLVVFFIFVVSNCGGLLTPLGDPPLFLGFLKGVPFSWTMRLWKEWLLVNIILIVLGNVVDQYIFDREEKERKGSQLEQVMEHEPLGILGWHNFLFLTGIVLVILGKGQSWGGEWPFGVQEILMTVITLAAYFSTKKEIRAANCFTFAPIIEVAVLFAGIFITMIAPLTVLNVHGKELGLTEPWQYFWGTGLLSSFLDNAPTYLTFAATAAGSMGVSVESQKYLAEFLAAGGTQAAEILVAISCGAVFMGANTYIGNGPNFMVKAIAEENKVKMPSFFGYMAWSGAILMPIFLVVTLVFF
ncbi:sodium:proton antiporter [Candidatus Electronema sp. PJ]|uniref:sodium:proton antiporter n=1 Tax=Candidatus Electronema sp. PJ TaxID=3401572 RepID=UPI003AA932FA